MLFLLLSLALLFPGCGSATAVPSSPFLSPPSETVSAEKPAWFRIILLDVGQGDAALLLAPTGETALIDTGMENIGDVTVLDVMEDLHLEKLDMIFISHHHDDHIGGLRRLLEEPWKIRPAVIDKNNAVIGKTYRLGDIAIDMKGANGRYGDFEVPLEERGNENYLSHVLLIRYKRFRYATLGDLTGGGGNPPYQTIDLESHIAPLIGDVDILLIPHHGSNTSSNETLLSTLLPEVALISVGNGNEFFHPHPSVIRRLKERNLSIYQTEQGWVERGDGIHIVNDHICIVTDGYNYRVKAYSVDKCSAPH